MAILIIFLYGADGYRIKENVDIIVSAYRKKYKSGMSHYRFDFDGDKDFDKLAGAVKSVSFFDEAKLLLVKNIFSAPKGRDLASGGRLSHFEKLIALINDFKITVDKNMVLVFIENKEEKELQKIDKDLFTLLSSKNNLVRDIEYLNGVKLFGWVKSKFTENGHNISLAIADLLVSIAGNDSWSLMNEIEKISNYKTGGVITEKDVSQLVNRKNNNAIFDLTDAIGNQNKAKAFEAIFRLINSGYDGYYLLNMLFYHFENLLAVCDLIEKDESLSFLSIAKKCGLHPFVAKKAIGQVLRFKKVDLLARFNRLADLDISSKKGLANLEDSLYNFAICW